MTATVIGSMTAVFNEVFGWLADALSTVLTVFYADGSLTVLGVISIVGLSIAIFMLVMNVIVDFFRLR